MKASTTRNQNDDQIQTILDRLDAQDAANDKSNRRAAQRHNFRKHPITVRITQPGGGVVTCAVAGRELSSAGMSFLYRGFLYPGTSLRFTLRRRVGGEEAVEGTAVWCRHAGGPYHLIGVKFKQRIYPRLFAESAQGSDDDGGSVDPSKLTGTVLVVDDQELDCMLFEHHLKRTAMTAVYVKTTKAALEAVAKQQFGLILCDLNLGQQTRGEELIAQLRANHCTAPIVVLTSETSPIRLKAAQDAGAKAIVQKPYDPLMLLAVIGGMLRQATTSTEEAIYSELAGNASADALITHCLEKVRDMSGQLHAAIEANNLEQVRGLCQTLKGSGAGYGFTPLTEAAKLAVNTLDSSMSIEESIRELQTLESICKRLSPGKAPGAK